ncbi:MAG: hypothetical protein LBH76_05705, partial [Propionibacteriaceae bacterium]|jgi:hypothetical protein|nr:hypothetical protein [Propionibacteriaceae bacterium]
MVNTRSKGASRLWRVCVAAAMLAAVMAVPGAPPAAAADPTVTKSARVNQGQPDNGTKENPVPVRIGDKIEYTFKVNQPNVPSPAPRYDVVFALDWSASMNHGYEDGELAPPPLPDKTRTAWYRTKTTVHALSRKIFDDYPDSRIALMGMNANARSREDPRHVYLQVDTDYADKSQYSSVIENTFSVAPYMRFDDLGMFLQAAFDKQNGSATKYGGALTPYPDQGGKDAPEKTVIARKNFDRIPVIVFISDFQYGMGKPPGGRWEHFESVARSFKYRFSNGILLLVQCNTVENWKPEPYPLIGGQKQADKFTTTLNQIGGTDSYGQPRWGWVRFEHGETNSQMNDKLLNLIKKKAPPPVYVSIVDLLPAGLEYVSSTPAGIKGGDPVTGRDRITWSNHEVKSGDNYFKVVATVKDYGSFDNWATASITGFRDIPTNSTHHRAEPPAPGGELKLHVRQVAVERDGAAVQLPSHGYLNLSNSGSAYGLTVVSGAHGVGDTPFTDRLVTVTPADQTYVVRPITPQYYEAVGHVVTATAATHDPAGRVTGAIELDYAAQKEYWLTVYIRPMKGLLADHEWDVRSNSFGALWSG